MKKSSNLGAKISPADYEGREFDDGVMKLEEIDHKYIENIYDSICQTPAFFRITAKSEISESINQLFRRDIKSPIYIDQTRCRIDAPFNPSNKACGWHQEIFYYVAKSNFLQTWAPLIRDATVENGAIEICIGSHKEGIAKQSEMIHENVHYKYIVDEEIVKKYKTKYVEMKLGQLIIFSSKLIHRSGNNRSNHVRYSLVGINHNLDNENFVPPKLIVENKSELMQDYYDDVFKTKK